MRRVERPRRGRVLVRKLLQEVVRSRILSSAFCINLPLSFFIAIVVTRCMKLKKPPGTRQEKLDRIDFLGNFIFSACIQL
ncbi:BZ3500_MvSof-1268-A1-R1_Chr8-2g10144 [Microbotryum saponariae]|uniref:BZ3500_MvSof-1268-A1-R1_Chr8-2g10144 protein n=1 Tax=Microbotryum saponariae TaxID=289078 RepID=A0A2X0L9Z6_9BASI|nr:BZ3500_MvSof-1268-A1-R1_Chr8-2g10144 [Microbotryum saponariae]SDA01870.1 BZ3501_MvSof-1269-A2-R1_Chr8-2g09895 [Microbotryum saponariae]